MSQGEAKWRTHTDRDQDHSLAHRPGLDPCVFKVLICWKLFLHLDSKSDYTHIKNDRQNKRKKEATLNKAIT